MARRHYWLRSSQDYFATGSYPWWLPIKLWLLNRWDWVRVHVFRRPFDCSRTKHDLYHPKSLDTEQAAWLRSPRCDEPIVVLEDKYGFVMTMAKE